MLTLCVVSMFPHSVMASSVANLPAVAPRSAASLVVAPASGSPLQTITISGTNYMGGELVRVYWDITTTPLTTAFAGTTGNFVSRFSIPLTPYGRHSIVAVGQTSHVVATASFQVNSRIGLLKGSSLPGYSDVVVGVGFAPRETITATWNTVTGTVLGTTVSDGQGTFYGSGGITFTAPFSPAGSYPVIASGQTSRSRAAAFLTLNTPLPPVLALSPNSGPPTSRIVVSGTGYGPHESVQLTIPAPCPGFFCPIPPPPGTPPWIVGTAVAGLSGTFNISVMLPITISNGPVNIVAIGLLSHYQSSATFTVTPPIVNVGINPSTGPGATTTVISGTGYGPNETVGLDINMCVVGGIGCPPDPYLPLGTTQTDATGAFSMSVTIPVTAAIGVHVIGVGGFISQFYSSTTFTVTPPVLAFALTPPSGPGATTTIITGTGYGPNETVGVDINPCLVGSLNCTYYFLPLGTAQTNAAGTFSMSVTIPVTATIGPHVLDVYGFTSQFFGTVPFTVTPPVLTLVANPSSGPVNSSITISGTGFGPGETVGLSFYAPCVLQPCSYYWVPLGTPQADAQGTFSLSTTIPITTTPGSYDLSAYGFTSQFYDSIPFTVTSQVLTMSLRLNISPEGSCSQSIPACTARYSESTRDSFWP